MLVKLLGSVVAKIMTLISTVISERPDVEYSDELVQKFQRYVRQKVFVSLIREIKDGLPGKGDADTKDAVRYLEEHCGEIMHKHLANKKEYERCREQELKEQISNMYPDYSRAEALDARSHWEAFIVVVVREWMEKGGINLEHDEEVKTDGFVVWRNSIDEAITYGIIEKGLVSQEDDE